MKRNQQNGAKKNRKNREKKRRGRRRRNPFARRRRRPRSDPIAAPPPRRRPMSSRSASNPNGDTANLVRARRGDTITRDRRRTVATTIFDFAAAPGPHGIVDDAAASRSFTSTDRRVRVCVVDLLRRVLKYWKKKVIVTTAFVSAVEGKCKRKK